MDNANGFTGKLRFDEKGLIPVIVQEDGTNRVLMLAYANMEAIEKTIETGKMHYYSRSRQSLWLKGETSGHFQHMVSMRYDCDADTVLAIVKQDGVACHTGDMTCFDGCEAVVSVDGNGCGDESSMSDMDVLKHLSDTVSERAKDPIEGSYTNYLLDKGMDKILKKVGEEAAEIIIAAKNNSKDELTYETADLLFHLSVMLHSADLEWKDIFAELISRRGKKSKVK